VNARRTRHSLSPRVRRIVWLTGSVVAVAVVIVVAAAFNAPRPTTSEPGAPVAASGAGARDYESALAALASGETTKAVELLRTAAAAGSVSAQTKLAELAKTPGASAATTRTAPSDDQFTGQVADLTTLLPTAIQGYVASAVEPSPTGAILSIQPAAVGPATRVTLIVMTVLDKGTEAGARDYVAKLSAAYPDNGSEVTVGSRSGRFGTSGSRLAAVAFSRGRYAFEVVATSSRPDPVKIKDIALGVAAEFPAAR
jgi:hypothetical protein